MKKGNWIPVDKNLKNLFPKNKEYTKLEAYLSLRISIDDNEKFTFSGKAALWGWTRNRARRFIKNLQNTSDQAATRRRPGGDQALRFVFSDLQSLATRQRPDSDQAATTNNKTNTKTNTKTFCRNSEEFRLSELLFLQIKKRNPHYKKPDLQKWAKSIDMMIRIDKRTPTDIENVIMWVSTDIDNSDSKWGGWATVILSTSKLREKYDTISERMITQKTKPQKSSGFDALKNF